MPLVRQTSERIKANHKSDMGQGKNADPRIDRPGQRREELYDKGKSDDVNRSKCDCSATADETYD